MRKALVLLTVAAMVAASALLGSAVARERRVTERSAHQIIGQYNAHTTRINADLRLMPEQEGKWGDFESAMKDFAKTNADRQIVLRDECAQQKGPVDVITVMRRDAKFLSEL
jgi:hypothetical protein